MSGGDVKQAVCLHKLIFEAIIRTKVKHFNYCSNFLTEEGRKLFEDFQKCVNFEIIETIINRSSKPTGGLSGKTENVGASEKCMQINHIMDTLREHLDSVVRKRTGLKNIDCGMKRFLSDGNDVKMLSKTLEEWVNNLWTSEQPLVNIATGK